MLFDKPLERLCSLLSLASSMTKEN